MNNFIIPYLRRIYSYLLKKLIRLAVIGKQGSLQSVFNELVLDIEQNEKVFITMHKRPQYADSVGIWSDRLINRPKLGLVIQGPLVKDLDFTLETVRIYKKTFAGSTIILSTWKDEETKYLDLFRKEGIEIVLNGYPANPGQSNINYQIVSSSAGTRRAKESGAEYLLKTRTDQRICGINVEEYLFNTIKAFPVSPGYDQKERIIGVSLDSFKYRPYDLSDMIIYGHIDDAMVFWGAELDKREVKDIGSVPLREWIAMRFAHIYLVTEYLFRIGREPKGTLEDSWQIFADHFCVVDHASLDLFWFKYDRHNEYKWSDYSSVRNSQLMSFHEWFNMYSNLRNKTIPDESILDEPFTSVITPDSRGSETSENRWDDKISVTGNA